MVTRLRNFWNSITSNKFRDPVQPESGLEERTRRTINRGFEIAPDDPVIDYFMNSPGVVEINKVSLESPGLQALKDAGVKISVPLINQGELVGLLNLGPRLSEQEYSADDYRLLSNLATQASPALRVAQLVRQQQAEVQERERLEHELRVARTIQQTLLPKNIPELPGWQLAAYWQPARAVGGDFYDFVELPEGRLGLVIGDVTDKGVPAALVMATTRSILRSAAERYSSASQVLFHANNILCAEIPPNMFVTCQYMILDPISGRLLFANAGHNLPYRRSSDGVIELRATGMPLGLMPEMNYDEKEIIIARGETILFYSDGLVEAHNSQREMFSFQHLRELLTTHPGGPEIIDFLLIQLADFTGPDWEQEDDVTLMMLERKEEVVSNIAPSARWNDSSEDTNWRVLTSFTLPSVAGNERKAMERVAEAVQELNWPVNRLERLKTAVAETTMNAIEHGNKYQAELPVSIQVLVSDHALKVQVTDEGGDVPIPENPQPDIEAKLSGLQGPRGWGLFLIKNMVDEMRVVNDQKHHTVELIFNLEGGVNDRKATGS